MGTMVKETREQRKQREKREKEEREKREEEERDRRQLVDRGGEREVRVGVEIDEGAGEAR